MIEKIKNLLKIKNEKGKFVLSAEEVAKTTNKHTNSVYSSRQSGNYKLDKLAIFEKIKKIVDDSNVILMRGDKANIKDQIEIFLQDEKRYLVTIEEI